MKIGECQGALGRHDEARAIYREIIELDSKSNEVFGDAFFLLGYDLVTTGDPAWAVEAYRKVIELVPRTGINCLNAHCNIAQCFIEQGDLLSAEEICRAAIELETLEQKEYGDLRDNYGCTYSSLGDCLRAKHDFTGACEAYENALERKSINAKSLISFANCLLKLSSSNIEVSRKRLLKKAAKSLKNVVLDEIILK
jgi:tetratricopeptide (TPR) repeat protein